MEEDHPRLDRRGVSAVLQNQECLSKMTHKLAIRTTKYSFRVSTQQFSFICMDTLQHAFSILYDLLTCVRDFNGMGDEKLEFENIIEMITKDNKRENRRWKIFS